MTGVQLHGSDSVPARAANKRSITDTIWIRALIVVAGIVFGQAVLYGPSLIGQKILLPLDVLTQPGTYIPPSEETKKITPHDLFLSDLVLQLEPARRFAVSEIHHGRFPIWAPYQYGGVPFIWPKYSLFLLLECCTKSPLVIAWVQLFAALVGGAGMFAFCRRSLGVGFWPATICAWCYPLTAFFILWQGYFTALPVYWLPWLFLSVDRTVRSKNPLAPIGLSVVTFLVLTAGQIDISGQVLLGSGLYSIWCLWRTYLHEWFRGKAWMAISRLVAAWAIGFLLAAPHLLPLLEYAKTGSRMMHRSEGVKERPPVGLAALPQVVLPDIYGTTTKGSVFIAPPKEGNLLESPSAAYAGVVATLFVAPLAWCDRRYRSMNLFWCFLAFLGLSWCLNVPGLVALLSLPGLNMMSHNRLVFLASFAVFCLTAIGLESLWSHPIQRRWWFWLPAMLLAGLGGWCFYRSEILPTPVSSQQNFEAYCASLREPVSATLNVHPVQAWFILHFTMMAILSLLGFAGWLLVWFQGAKRFRWMPALVLVLVGDLLWFGDGRSSQCDRALYYPKIPVLNQIALSAPGRVIGVDCLPAPIMSVQGLSDIRGYDSVDPARMVNLLRVTALPGREFSYAAVQYLTPDLKIQPPDTIRLPPILDMLDVRYLVFQGIPAPDVHPHFKGGGYWALVNSNALPRVFVPESVETVTKGSDELDKLASPQFNPAKVAYVESRVILPASCRGTAQITNEIPTRILISARLETPGMVVLADNWDRGWRAYWNGKSVPVLRTNYAVCGVVLPAGSGTLEFLYKPRSLILGLWLAGLGAIVLSAWSVGVLMRKRISACSIEAEISTGFESNQPDSTSRHGAA